MVTFSNPGELVKFLAEARAAGVVRLRLGELEADMLPPSPPAPKKTGDEPDASDDLLMHSAGA